MVSLHILQQIKNTVSNKNNLFLFLLLLTPFIYIESLFDNVDLPRFAYVALIASFWLVTWLIQLNNKKTTINWNPLFFIILFLLFFSSNSYLWGNENTFYQAELYFYTCLVIICFLSMQIKPKSIYRFSTTATMIASACAVIGILQSWGINTLDYKQIAPPAATFINKNFAANYFDLILPVALTLFFISKNKKEAWISAVSVSLIISYLLLTKSRGTYLATIATFSVFLISIQLFPWLKKQTALISRLYKKQIIFIIFIPILLFSLPRGNFQPDSGAEENHYASFFSGKQQNSISLRLNAYQNSLDLLKENPVLGVGLGGFHLHFRPYTQSTLAKNKIFSDFIYLHNDPLQLFVELGMIGGVTVFLFLIFLFRTSFITLYNNPEINTEINHPETKTLYIGFFIAIIASIFHSLFSFPLHQPTSATFFAIWVGILLNFSSRKIFVTNFIQQKRIYILTISLVILFLVVISNFYFKYIQSSYYMAKSVMMYKMRNCNKAGDFAILSINTYAKDYLAQSQGINIIASCPLDTKKQLKFAENILQNNPMHPTALYLAGISYFKLGNYDLSHKILKSLSFLYPYFTGSYTFLGHIAVRQKDYNKAKSHYEHALKLAPNNKAAQNLLTQLIKKGY